MRHHLFVRVTPNKEAMGESGQGLQVGESEGTSGQAFVER